MASLFREGMVMCALCAMLAVAAAMGLLSLVA